MRQCRRRQRTAAHRVVATDNCYAVCDLPLFHALSFYGVGHDSCEPLGLPAWLPGVHSAEERRLFTLSARTRRLEREHREIRGKAKIHLPNRLIPGLGGKCMMLQDLGISEIAL